MNNVTDVSGGEEGRRRRAGQSGSRRKMRVRGRGMWRTKMGRRRGNRDLKGENDTLNPENNGCISF